MTEWAFSFKFAAVGICIVFAALASIVVAVSLIRLVNQRWQDHEERQKEKATEKEPSIDSLTLVLISAAVSTMLQGRFHIRSVRRLLPKNASRSPWSAQGRAILHGSHVVPKKR